jgi:hypothetical protein
MARLILIAIAAGVLAGCTSDPRYDKGLQWVLENEAEKKRLNDLGFPQYNTSGAGGN